MKKAKPIRAAITIIKLKLFPVLLFISIFQLTYGQNYKLRFNHLTVDNGLSQNTVQAIISDKYGFMWFGTWEGINVYDGYSIKTFKASDKNLKSIPNNRINNFFKDSAENIWVSTGNYEVCRYNYNSEDFTRYTNESVPAYINENISNRRKLKTVKTSQYSWEISGQGLLQHAQGGGNVLYQKDPFDLTSINDNNVISVYLDNSGILWVGTQSGGVNFADTQLQPIEYYYHTPGNSNTIIDNGIRAICEDSEYKIWVGTQSSGVSVIEPRSGKITNYSNTPGKSVLAGNDIRDFCTDAQGNMWIGTKTGLTRIQLRTGKRFNYFAPANIPDNNIFYIIQDHLGEVWIATFNGVARYNPETDAFLTENTIKLPSPKTRVLLEDRHFNLWVGTEDGGLTVFKRNPTNTGFSTIEQFDINGNNGNQIVSNTILALCEDKKGTVWVGTNNGINTINSGDMRVQNTSSIDLPDKLIMGILCDSMGNVWISHKKGLSKIASKGELAYTYTKSDGLQGNEFSQNACYFSKRNGNILFGGINGLNIINPYQLQDNKVPPHIYITSLTINTIPVEINQEINKRVLLTHSMLNTTSVRLKANENSFAIGFSALHFKNTLGNRYAIKLEGYHESWTYLKPGERNIQFQNIKPGRYIFKVRAANCDGYWNETPATLTIIIERNYTWALISFSMVILVFVAGAVLFLNKRFTFLKSPTNQQNQNESENTETSTIQQDPFITEVKQKVLENMANAQFNAEELSRMFNMSPRQFYRKLKSGSNQTVLEIITEVRVENAKELLKSGKLNIAEVAFKVGFSEPSNFTRTFTRTVGMSPTNYIKSLKNNT